MSKTVSFFLLNFSFLLPGIVLISSLSGNANEPALPISDVELPLCYMETVGGRRIDLKDLCPSMPEDASSACSSGDAGIPISNVRYDGNTLRGQVTNQTCKIVNLIKVNYQVLDEQGNQIDNGFIYAQPSTLAQGKNASFAGAISAGAEVNITYVEWSTM
jgi:hypothetical protein